MLCEAMPDKNKEYYAVRTGRVDEPTIFSSWGDAHPRVIGCKAKHKGFDYLQEAKDYMEENGVKQPKLVIKEGAGETTPLPGNEAFYAVANGRNLGIYPYYEKAKPEVDRSSGACHKHFRTRAQAEAFIEDWKNSYADVCRREIKAKLDQGFRPSNMNLEFDIWRAIFEYDISEDITKETEKLDLKEE
jgi:viroplasmin and RNaseH domain-containing protein